MFLKKAGLLSCLFAAGCIGTVNAQSFVETLSYTYQTNPTLLSERAYLQSVDEKLPQAKAGYRPYLALQGEAAHAYQRVDSDKRDLPRTLAKGDESPRQLTAQFVQPIFSGFKTVSGVKMTESMIEAERSALMGVEQNVLQGAAVAFVDVLEAQAVLELQIKNEQVLTRHLQSAKDKFKFGSLTQTDVDQSEARLERAKAARLSAEGNLQVERATYQKMVGRLPEKLKNDIDINHLLPVSLDEAIDWALASNPMIHAAKQQEMASRYKVNVSRGDLLPSVDFVAAAGRKWSLIEGHDQADFWQVGAQMTIPLYQGGADYAKVREAKQLANQSRILVEKARQEIVEKTTQSWEIWQSSRASMRAIKSQISASKSALDGVRREAEVGARTVLDVLDAEQEYLDTQVNLVKAQRNELAAKVALLASVGRMTADALKLDVEIYKPENHYEQVSGKWFGTGI